MPKHCDRRLQKWKDVLGVWFLCTLMAGNAFAHFLVLLPSSDVVDPGPNTEVKCEIFFGHPMDQSPPLPAGKPQRVGFVRMGEKVDLTDQIQEENQTEKFRWVVRHRLNRPGDYVFFVEGAPYWEEAERQWLVHSAKVVVQFAGIEVGWDQQVGLPVEIIPLCRPYGLWAGNCFRGIVLYQGKPLPGATVEVEFWNAGSLVQVPHRVLSTQVVKTDSQGVFCYTIPWAGWWGFVALVEGPSRPGPDGREAPVEFGGAIWIRAVAPPGKASVVSSPQD